jgi:tRNA G18 (ribose-2'-O)-methylase SpoU
MLSNKNSKSELIISGKNLVTEALKSKQNLKTIYIFKGMNPSEKEKILSLIQKAGLNFEYKDKDSLEKISGTSKGGQ